MKKFLTHIVFLIITCIMLMYISDFVYTSVYENSKSPRNKLEYVYKTKDATYDVVFLGSSRVENHINTKLFDSVSGLKSINLGVGGAGFNYNLLQLKLLIKANNIKNVLLQVDFNYNGNEAEKMVMAHAMPYLRDSVIKKHIEKYVDKATALNYIPFYRYAVYEPKIGFREVLMSILGKKPNINFKYGFEAAYGKAKNFKTGSLPEKISDSNEALDEITELCKVNNINLILYISPMCSLQKKKNYLKDLKDKIPDLLDLSEGYNQDLFYDCLHLNNEGANIFTKEVFNLVKIELK